MDYHFGLIYNCVTTDSNILHQFQPYLQRLSCKNALFSLRIRGGLKKDFEFSISILCYRRRPIQFSLRPSHCDFECFVRQTMYISIVPLFYTCKAQCCIFTRSTAFQQQIKKSFLRIHEDRSTF